MPDSSLDLPSATTERTIGAQIRERRESRGLTLTSVAEAIGVTPSLLSQVENGKAQPSLNTLRGVAEHLHLSVDALLGLGASAAPPGHAVLQARADGESFEVSGGARWERLGGSLDRAFELLRISYPPGAASTPGEARVRYPGYEFGVLLSGELTLQLGFETIPMTAGDSVSFDASEPHRYENAGDEEAEGVWISVRDPVMYDRVLSGIAAAGTGPRTNSALAAVFDALNRDGW